MLVLIQKKYFSRKELENIKEKYDYEDKGFYTDLENIKEAYNIAKTLFKANVGEIYE